MEPKNSAIRPGGSSSTTTRAAVPGIAAYPCVTPAGTVVDSPACIVHRRRPTRTASCPSTTVKDSVARGWMWAGGAWWAASRRSSTRSVLLPGGHGWTIIVSPAAALRWVTGSVASGVDMGTPREAGSTGMEGDAIYARAYRGRRATSTTAIQTSQPANST